MYSEGYEKAGPLMEKEGINRERNTVNEDNDKKGVNKKIIQKSSNTTANFKSALVTIKKQNVKCGCMMLRTNLIEQIKEKTKKLRYGEHISLQILGANEEQMEM